ncbi:MAG: family 20 glycosylhydrolase [Oscillospiraceae bacterium]|nr:family 20 glycosylhydrolase [Oscillospiraceae bacterium]
MEFVSNNQRLQNALQLLRAHAPLYGKFSEFSIIWLPGDANSIRWVREDKCLTLRADSISDALCLLGRALTMPEVKEESLTPRFARLAAMIDLSRNSVYTLKTMKRFLCQLALMGFNTAYLYMEDTYELPGYPYFGYRRGRYSVAEQKELDDFADALGIELVPCIQTLAHLRTAIRWKYMEPMRDTVDNLMVGQDGTNALVEAMIAHFSKTFRSRRIHLGMDEAVSLGTGRYLRHQGYRSHREIIMEHLQTTCSLCKKYGLEPMIWDDMLFRDHTPLMNYYCDSDPITPELKAQFPDNLSFVYWDYYHDTRKEYERQLARRGCVKTLFAGGMWKWGGWVPNFTKSFHDSICAVDACCAYGVQEIIVTLWGDDGDETPLFSVLPGLALFGLLRFGYAAPGQTDAMCRLLSDTPLAVYEAMEHLDLIPDLPEKNLEALIPHKLLLYGDIASELFMGSITDDPQRLARYYRELSDQYAAMWKHIQDDHLQNILKMYQHLSCALSARCDAAVALHEGYRKKDSSAIDDAVYKLMTFAGHVKQLHCAAVLVWSRECKGQGMEIIDLRLGGVQARCQALAQRLKLYQEGVLDTLTELDEPELPYQGIQSEDGHTPGRESYGEIVTANTLCHQFSI